MGLAHVGLVHRDPCECKVKGFRAVSSIERNVSNRRHLQGVRQFVTYKKIYISEVKRYSQELQITFTSFILYNIKLSRI